MKDEICGVDKKSFVRLKSKIQQEAVINQKEQKALIEMLLIMN